MADLTAFAEAELKKLYDEASGELKSILESKLGITPEIVSDTVATVEGDASATVAVAKKDYDDLMQEVRNMKAQIASLKGLNGAVNQINVEAQSQGGAPVEHDLFLANGQTVKNHAGLATHYADPTSGQVIPVVGAYPSATVSN